MEDIDIFGRMAGTATICGDLISPIEDAGWTATGQHLTLKVAQTRDRRLVGVTCITDQCRFSHARSAPYGDPLDPLCFQPDFSSRMPQ
jgi:hypothetical protein